MTTKKSRLNQPPAVLVFETASEKLYSVNTSTHDDCCFVVQEGNFFCVRINNVNHEEQHTSRLR